MAEGGFLVWNAGVRLQTAAVWTETVMPVSSSKTYSRPFMARFTCNQLLVSSYKCRVCVHRLPTTWRVQNGAHCPFHSFSVSVVKMAPTSHGDSQRGGRG